MHPAPASHRKRNKKYNLEGHAHFLTCSCYRRLPLFTNDTWADVACRIDPRCLRWKSSQTAPGGVGENVALVEFQMAGSGLAR